MKSPSNSQLREILLPHLLPSSLYIYGFANLSGLLRPEFGGYRYGISIARRLDDRIVDRVTDAPTFEYLQHYLAVNRELDSVTEAIAADLRSAGIGVVTFPATVSTGPKEFDSALPDLRYKISHKMVATRVGLGWIGKTDLFVSKKFGPRLRLSSILIDQVVQPEQRPVERSRCGKCSICVEKCPAQAATGQSWDIHTDRDVFFDAFKCRDKCSEFGRTVLKADRRICGICVAVCPLGTSRT
jgi:epoxyqueuosine reductase